MVNDKDLLSFDYKKDFPLLAANDVAYLDNSATTQKPACVIEAERDFYFKHNANPLRGLYDLAMQATDIYEDARVAVQKFINAKSEQEIIFTRNTTESLNLVAYSYGLANLKPGDEIVTTIMEHHSNMLPWRMVAQQTGAVVKYIECAVDGSISDEAIDAAVTEKTKIVAMAEVSNVLGRLNPIAKAIAAAHRVGAVAVIDAAQSAPHMAIDVQKMDADFLAFSGHKMLGPMGIGVLYGKRDLLDRMPPFLSGGDMVDRVSFEKTTFAPVPLKFEAGTANFVGAIALGEAVRYVRQFDAAEVEAHERALLLRATEGLERIPGLRIYGTTPDKCAIVSFNVEGVHPYDMGMILDKLGIAVRTGQHCAEPVMTHYGVTGMCRASFAMYNTLAEADALVAGVERAVKMLK